MRVKRNLSLSVSAKERCEDPFIVATDAVVVDDRLASAATGDADERA